MFGALKKIFRRAEPQSAPSQPAENISAGEAAPQPSHALSKTDTGPDIGGESAFSESGDGGESVSVSFAGIVRLLPRELQGKTSPRSGAKFSIPVNYVLDQLPHGAVKVRLKDLRRNAPVGVLVAGTDHDEKLVDLPLGEIVPQLRPEFFSRRPQQQFEAPPEEGTDLFTRGGAPASPLRVMTKDEILKPTESAPAPVAAPAPVVAPAPVFTAAPKTPAPAPAISFATSAAAAALRSAMEKPAPAPVPTPAPAPVAPRTVAPVAPVPAAPAPVIPVPAGKDALLVPLSAVCVQWPDTLRNEIAKWSGPERHCYLPADSVGSALKSGSVKFSWREIKTWIQPPPPSGIDPVPLDAVLELPLKVVAPLYLATVRGGGSGKKVSVGENIPDVFSKSGLAAAHTAKPEDLSSSEPEADVLPMLSVSLSLLSQRWPDPLRKEIALLRLTDAKVEIPLETVESALKVGRFECYWKQICHWLKPCPTAALASVHADMRLEMPLNLITPLFLNQRPNADLPQGGTTQPGVDVVARPVAAPSPTAVAADPAAPRARNLAELFGEPDKRNWTPNEIVHKTAALPEVAGALMALQDGLLVASCMPPEWKSETIAAFLPQIFGRMKQYSKELKMGELESLTFSVEHGTFQIFNVGIIYFAALAKPDSAPPKESLKIIVSELSRHTR